MELTKRINKLNEERDQHLEDVKIEIFEKVDESIKKTVAHLKASPETERRLALLESSNKMMAHQVSEMYELFTSFGWLGKTTLKIFGGIGIIAAAIISCIELVKRTK